MCGGGGEGAYDDDNGRAEEEARIRRENQERIINQADVIKQKTLDLAKSFPAGSDTKTFLDKLGAYLAMRSKKTFWDFDYVQISTRTSFISKCIDTISAAKNRAISLPSLAIEGDINKNIDLIKREMTKLNNFLAEESIKPFKGCFSQEMYNVLTTYQNYPSRRKQAVRDALAPVMAVAVADVVGEYDENGDILNNEIPETKSLKP